MPQSYNDGISLDREQQNSAPERTMDRHTQPAHILHCDGHFPIDGHLVTLRAGHGGIDLQEDVPLAGRAAWRHGQIKSLRDIDISLQGFRNVLEGRICIVDFAAAGQGRVARTHGQ